MGVGGLHALYFWDFVVPRPRASQRVVPELPGGVEGLSSAQTATQPSTITADSPPDRETVQSPPKAKPQPAQDIAQQGTRLADGLTSGADDADVPGFLRQGLLGPRTR